MTEHFAEIVAAGEYDHYGVRAHRSACVVGETLGRSRLWIDGECTDSELSGISALKVADLGKIEALIARLKSEYCWDNETIVLVGGYTAEWGEDAGEIVIKDNVCLAIL